MKLDLARLYLVAYFTTSIAAYDDNEHVFYSGWPQNSEIPSDDNIVDQMVSELHNIDATPDLDPCTKCKTKLEIGKFVALAKPELAHEAFMRWCIESGHDEMKCLLNFGPDCPIDSATGSDFVKVLQVMQPTGFDGDYFCYYHDPKCHVLPKTPEIDLSSWWPKKPRYYDAPEGSGETFNVVHIGDLDVQLSYKISSEANCSQSMCCSKYSLNEEVTPRNYDYASFHDPSHHLSFYASSYAKGQFDKGPYVDIYNREASNWLPAHEFGAYTCDAPELLINNTLNIIKDFHDHHLDFEFAIFTGGVVDHSDSEFVSQKQIFDSERKVYRDIKHTLGDINFYPAVGSRDSFPLAQLAPKSLGRSRSPEWDYIADIFEEHQWLDFDSIKEVRYSQGSYSTTTSRGLKIISLNSNIWNYKNLYAYINSTSFGLFGQFKYLVDELVQSEYDGQRVWIIAHLPLSQDSLPIPAKVFTKIVERFSPKVIAGIFFGHKLKDQFNILYSSDGTDSKQLNDALNFAWIAPSVTPYSGLNPAWRYYSVDTTSFAVVNAFTFYTKLNHTFVNDGAEPTWEFEYSAREVYDPEHLWPAERALDTEFWHHAAEKIRDRPEINQMFTDFAYRKSPFTPVCDECDDCDDNYCEVTSFTVDDRKKCMITEDQDDYCAPGEKLEYIPTLRPYEAPEYQLVEADMEDEEYFEHEHEKEQDQEGSEDHIDEDQSEDQTELEESEEQEFAEHGESDTTEESNVDDNSHEGEETPRTDAENLEGEAVETSKARESETAKHNSDQDPEAVLSIENTNGPYENVNNEATKTTNHPDFGVQSVSKEGIRQRVHNGYKEVANHLKSIM